MPAVNQVELHPTSRRTQLRAFHAEHGIVTESWSPLARRGELLQGARRHGLAEAHGVTPDAGRAALARPARRHADPEVGRSRASAREHRRLRLRAHATRSRRSRLLERGRLWDEDPDTHEEF